MTEPLTAGVLVLIFMMRCVTILVFNRQLIKNTRERVRIKAEMSASDDSTPTNSVLVPGITHTDNRQNL
ncbi:hypothetical protein C443_17863 [Haloarcula argentinensis DSM 12282]|nr:hypothetical protein C443_17863 [Haloarcula argentinensis DSM 12282]